MLGDKASAREAAIAAGVPVIPASAVLPPPEEADWDAIRARAGEIGYPLMLKASWGGGGRGMRPIAGPEELEAKVREGYKEAEQAFGRGEGYLEKMIERARHVEVQILGDHHGHLSPVGAGLLGPAAQPEGRGAGPGPLSLPGPARGALRTGAEDRAPRAATNAPARSSS